MTISTQGWDTVFALRLPEVNAVLSRAIATGSTRLPALNWTAQDGTAWLIATFDPWQLTSKGLQGTGGTIVKMRFPIKHGIFSYGGETAIGGITVIGTVRLGKITEASHTKLVLDHAKGVKIDDIESSSPLPSAVVQNKVALEMALTEAISAVLSDFRHVFASVDLNNQLKDAVPWLAPKAVDYCFMGGENDAESYFGTLCMTDCYIAGNPTPPASLSAELVPSGANAALLLSRNLFFRNLLLPGVARGLAPKDHAPSQAELAEIQQMFNLVDNGRKIVKKSDTPALFMKTEPIDLSILYAVEGSTVLIPVVGQLMAFTTMVGTFFSELITHGKPDIAGQMSIYMETLTIQEETGKIVFRIGQRCHIKPAPPLPEIEIVTATFDITASFDLVMQPDGKVEFRQAGSPTHTTPVIDAPDWIKNSSTAIEIILAIVGTIATVATEGLASVLIGIEFALLTAEIKALPMVIGYQLGGSTGTAAPDSLELLVIAAMSPVMWSDRSFKLTSVALNEDFVFGGTFVIDDASKTSVKHFDG